TCNVIRRVPAAKAADWALDPAPVACVRNVRDRGKSRSLPAPCVSNSLAAPVAGPARLATFARPVEAKAVAIRRIRWKCAFHQAHRAALGCGFPAAAISARAADRRVI